MGKQTNFFIYGQDEIILLKNLAKNPEISLFSEKGEVLDTAFPKTPIFFMTKKGSKIYKRQSGYVDQITSEVIQFTRCVIKENKQLWEGSLWFTPKYYDNKGQLVIKPSWLNDLYFTCQKWISKNLQFEKQGSYCVYIGKEAYKLYKQGYKMMNAPKVSIEFTNLVTIK